MPLVNLKKLLDPAYKNGYAVGAFNVVNLEFLEAVVETAEANRSPVILNIAEAHFPYMKLENICPLILSMAARASIPVALNLDHGMTKAGVLQALRHGFTSVMFDGSKLSFAENVRHSRDVVELCHPLNVSVEAELGAVGGDEGGALESEADPQYFTDPDQADAFVRQTGVDALAVAIGNAHGRYKGEPKLDFKRLERIKNAVNVPLVLHGGSGISADDFHRACQLGIAKINFYTGMSQAALLSAENSLKEKSAGYHDYPELMQAIKKAVSQIVREQIDIFGSSQKAGEQIHEHIQ